MKMENGNELNVLERAERTAKAFFKKQYNDCYTYERNYIIKQIARGVF